MKSLVSKMFGTAAVAAVILVAAAPAANAAERYEGSFGCGSSYLLRMYSNVSLASASRAHTTSNNGVNTIRSKTGNGAFTSSHTQTGSQRVWTTNAPSFTATSSYCG